MAGEESRRSESYTVLSGSTGVGSGSVAGGSPRDAMFRQLRDMQGPFAADSAMRQAIMNVWRSLPEESRTIEKVVAESQRLLDRAVREFREDAAVYGFEP